jgi:hypothetical protein
MASFLAAATASRAYIATNSILVLVPSLALYCVSNLTMVRLMREGGMGLAISVNAVSQLLLINLIAVESIPALFDQFYGELSERNGSKLGNSASHRGKRRLQSLSD